MDFIILFNLVHKRGEMEILDDYYPPLFIVTGWVIAKMVSLS